MQLYVHFPETTEFICKSSVQLDLYAEDANMSDKVCEW